MNPARLMPSHTTFVVKASSGKLEVARTYVLLGIQHILLGVDHLLFALALLIIVRGGRRILLTITAFTVAHSITLVAATLGWLALPGAPVEATIALSIAFLAREIAMSWRGHAGLTERMPWLVAFVFGLLHGLGFAEPWRRSACHRTRFPWRCCASTSAWKLGNCSSSGRCLGSRGAPACGLRAGARRCAGSRHMSSARWRPSG